VVCRSELSSLASARQVSLLAAPVLALLPTVHDDPPTDPVLESDLDIISDRIINIVLNDDGPNMNTGYDPQPRSPVDLQSSPTELKVEDVLPEVQKILSCKYGRRRKRREDPNRPPRRLGHLPSIPVPLTPIDRQKLNKERNQRTVRLHNIFDSMGKQITALSEELTVFKSNPSLDAFTTIQSKFGALQDSLVNQKRKTDSLDAKRDQLVSRLKSLNDNIQEVRALLATAEDVPRKVSNGEVFA
jgi:hypothetical protein